MSKNKLAYGEWSFSIKGPVGMKMASGIGFDGVDLTDYDGAAAHFPMNNPRIQDEYLNAAAKYGMEIHAYHLYSFSHGGDMIHPLRSEKGQMAQLILKKGVDACQDMNIPYLLITAEGQCDPRTEYETKNYLGILNDACTYAQGKDVTICFEGVLPLKKVMRIIKGTDNRVKCCYDIMNAICSGWGDPAEDIPAIGLQNIQMVHLKDAPEEVEKRCTLTTGIAQIAENTKRLLDLGYKDWFVCENYYNNHGDLDPYDAAAKDVQAMRALLE